ncbi:MAG: AraC family transcriptional regulator [Alphaproteobacteria bacterium]
MNSYRTAWESLDASMLMRLFTSNGRHVNGPFERRVGSDQLHTLWRTLATRQCENFLDFNVVNIERHRAYVLWRCLTTLPRLRVRRIGFGVFAMEFSGEKCTEQIEWSRWPSVLPGVPHVPVGKLRAAVKHLDEHLGERITIPELARTCRLSARHASRLFRVFTDMSVHQYLIRQRLIQARERLAWGDEPIVDIAYDLGFANQAHFINAFKHNTTFTPAQFRARYSSPDQGPVHAWVRSFRERLARGDADFIVQCLGMPDSLPVLRDMRPDVLAHGMHLKVLADTPSTALVHWGLHGTGTGQAAPSCDGILHLGFSPDGACRAVENYPHWGEREHDRWLILERAEGGRSPSVTHRAS